MTYANPEPEIQVDNRDRAVPAEIVVVESSAEIREISAGGGPDRAPQVPGVFGLESGRARGDVT
jgi:hypothetical protein